MDIMVTQISTSSPVIIKVLLDTHWYDFLKHPLLVSMITIAISLWLSDKFYISKKFPGRNKETINKIIELKNLLRELEFVYDRIITTIKHVQQTSQNLSENDKNEFNVNLNKEISRISNILNETIPLKMVTLDTDIQLYYEENGDLRNTFNEYFSAYKNITDFLVFELIKQPDAINKKLSELEGYKTTELYDKEKKLIASILKSKTINILKYK